MDEKAAKILAESIDGLSKSLMYIGIAYQKFTTFQMEEAQARLDTLEEMMDAEGKPQNNDQDDDGN